MTKRISLIFLCSLLVTAIASAAPLAFAGRPVFHQLTRAELIERSELIFIGWPAGNRENIASGCWSEEEPLWYVNEVLKGESALKGKSIQLRFHGFRFHETSTGAAPSYSADQYHPSFPAFDQRSYILFGKSAGSNCFEYTAQGAYEEDKISDLIRSMIAGPNDCDLQQKGLYAFLRSLPASCMTDADCALEENPTGVCAPPVAVNRKIPEPLMQELALHKNRLASACPADAYRHCPVSVNVVSCEAGSCKGRFELPAAKGLIAGEIRSSCAPHDGPATELALWAVERGAFPMLRIRWWNENQPKGKTGTYVLRFTGSHSSMNGSYCTDDRTCDSIRSGTVTITIADSEAKAEYDLELNRGSRLMGNVTVTHNRSPALCG